MRQTIINAPVPPATQPGVTPAAPTSIRYSSQAQLTPAARWSRPLRSRIFPGFRTASWAADLVVNIKAQAERFGTEAVLDDVVDLQLEGDVKPVILGKGDVYGVLSLIFATGSAYRKLAREFSAGLGEQQLCQVLAEHGAHCYCAPVQFSLPSAG